MYYDLPAHGLRSVRFFVNNAGKQHVFSNYSLTDILQYDRLKAVPERIHIPMGTRSEIQTERKRYHHVSNL